MSSDLREARLPNTLSVVIVYSQAPCLSPCEVDTPKSFVRGMLLAALICPLVYLISTFAALSVGPGSWIDGHSIASCFSSQMPVRKDRRACG